MNDGESMSHNIQVLNTNALLWGTSSSADFQPFPEWTKFLVELGGWIGGLPDTSGRLFCTVLLPSRILASSLVAFGALSRSLKDPSNAISWETFLDYEAGTKVYFLYNIPKKGKRQFEGALGDVTSYKNEYLREIHIDGRRREHKNLTMSLSKSLFEEASVSLQAHYRTTLLNSLNNLSISFQKILSPFNENRLLLSQEECLIVTNKAAWLREIEGLCLSRSTKVDDISLLSDLLMLNYGRVKLCSPRSREITSTDSVFSILDGIDALRSKDNITSNKTLILLDKNEYQEEAEDMIYSFSDYCDRNDEIEISEPEFTCPAEIEIQLYFFPRGDR